ncbi:MAG: hypothetical protein A2268_09725 [Candidatus Raymondbacteria bacterium RifOxyA12_full_50_37]|uniref:OmpA-like domain-containing protein n=1 Tax=Candidatus Raymondbacteria bacterium RIFOXYD12_FULL_49_13 TaxID=1817890 RepID=A0A1F7F1P3_UNCRA|nr:MAG: hypothetical protein A2268_09725 [Candidatus Raymondbacteria bacterium RifOxyA12_full_50_37]OGJ93881.1 MAG: hypothetical protein A2248_06570 [Candidatus Raymondbacteria bacterium RIFOXYA2_FULL_49_16]OGJ98250.1 MAG: hypothetical protein A2453_00595 [Candidatus Raymondbacteria bacterium RIFOXYC2_FULL_50_21]OGK00483.1 MAG: hypothetical protein A2519_10770 [Candidatus Raymondbacteria bacterium RIFOXYD12_FULL_49_13]OGK03866.1 MAG: hypothetical protein A2350_13490 [Candidatus Raymondbacteria 
MNSRQFCLPAGLILFSFFFNAGLAQEISPDPSLLGDPLYARAQRANASFNFQPDRKYGMLDVTTNTEGGLFYIGTSFVDQLPIKGLKLPAGKQDYVIIAPKHETITGTIEIIPSSQTNAINVFLPVKKGIVTIKTNPYGAAVYIGSSCVGITSEGGLVLSDLNEGKYRVRIEKNGFQQQEIGIGVVNGEKIGASVFLRELFGSVLVSCNAGESFVYINKIYWGRAPITVGNLSPGRAVVKIESNNYKPFEKTIFINPGKVTIVTEKLTKDRSFKDQGPYGALNGNWGDKDGDGIPNDEDTCPEDPEDVDNFKDSDGCPDPDNDLDGISDINEPENKYRDMPEDFDGYKDSDGVPDPDNDGDYIPDSQDLCINVPEDRDGFEDLDGCPETDNDSDGVPDSVDMLPNDPEDMDGFQDKDGAPDFDNDADGIKDFLDRCPGAQEIFNNFQDDDGCPDERVNKPTGGFYKRILYVPDQEFSDNIFAELDSAYNILQIFPDLKFEISVHSDNRGNKTRKMEETQERAQVIQRYFDYRLVVDKSRYSVLGRGGADPRASNVSEDGRAKNTRIDIKCVR